MTTAIPTKHQNLQSWLENKTNLVWLQPDALCAELDKSSEHSAFICLPAGCDGAVFIWDPEFLMQSHIGDNRQMFLWQALESLSENLGEDLLVIQAPMQTAVMTLMMQPLTLHSYRSPLSEPLFQMVQGLQQTPIYSAQVKWTKVKNWIDYPKPLPNGFFKFWKVAEQQLFPKNGELSNPKREYRPHK